MASIVRSVSSPAATLGRAGNIDGMNQKIWVIERESLAIVNQVGFGGHQAGGFTAAHSLAVDSSGSVYISGYTNGSLEGTNAGSFDAFLTKFDSSGSSSDYPSIDTPKPYDDQSEEAA